MIKHLISLLFLIASVWLSFKHAWDTWQYKDNPETFKMMTSLGISEQAIPFFVLLTVTIGVLLLIPATFFWGNLLNAVSIVIIMALALQAGNVKMALIEIPFLAMPLLMIWLKYPFHN